MKEEPPAADDASEIDHAANPSRDGSRDAAELFLLSAPDRAELSRLADMLATRAGEAPSQPLRDLAMSSARHPGAQQRLAVIALDPRDLASKLRRARSVLSRADQGRLRVRSGIYYGSGAPLGRTALLFPGQGSQYEGMLRQLYCHSSSARAWFDALDSAFKRAGERPPSELIFTSANAFDGPERERELFDMERGAQLCVFASLILYDLLGTLGVRGDVMVGHSNGEHAAFIASGAIRASSRNELCESACQIALMGRKLPAPRPPERMLAVNAFNRAAIQALVERHHGDLFVAMDNCPSQVVIAGTLPAIDAAEEEIGRAGGLCMRLPFERAYHTPLFGDWARALRSYYTRFTPAVPHTEVRCCATGRAVPSDPSAVWDLLAAQWSHVVQFREMIEALYQSGTHTFVEVGPNNRLTAFVEDTLRGKPHLAVAASSQHRSDTLQLKHLVGELYAHGLPVHAEPLDRLCEAILQGAFTPADAELPRGQQPWANRDTTEPARNTGGQTEPPQFAPSIRQLHGDLIRCAEESHARVLSAVRTVSRSGGMARRPAPMTPFRGPRTGAGGDYPLLGDVLRVDGRELHAQRHFDLERDPFLRDHSLGRRRSRPPSGAYPLPVLSFTLSLEILAEAASRLTGATAVRLSDLQARRWLALDCGKLTVAIHAERFAGTNPDGAVRVRLYEVTGGQRHLAFEGTVHVAHGYPPAPRPALRIEPDSKQPQNCSASSFYSGFAFHGPAYQGIDRVTAVGGHDLEADLVVTHLPDLGGAQLNIDPALLDCTGQLVAFWAIEHGEHHFGVFPFTARSLAWYRHPLPPGSRLRGRGQVRRDGLGNTEATFELIDATGLLVARMEGLAQRFVRFPPALHEVLFGISSETVRLSRDVPAPEGCALRTIDTSEWSILSASWGVWARALAHVMLTEQELAEWYGRPNDTESRAADLLAYLAMKEATQVWALRRGFRVATAEIEVRSLFGAQPRITHPALEHHALRISLERRGNVVAALVADADRSRHLSVSERL